MTKREQDDDCPLPGGGKTTLFNTSQQTDDGVGDNVSSAKHGSISCHIHYLLTRAASSK